MDIWTIIAYIVAIIFNMGVVAGIRNWAITATKSFWEKGRTAVAIVFLLGVVEQVLVSKGAALQEPDAFVEMLKTAWLMAAGSMGLHAVKKGTLGGI